MYQCDDDAYKHPGWLYVRSLHVVRAIAHSSSWMLGWVVWLVVNVTCAVAGLSLQPINATAPAQNA
jgi:hypothetical protein